MEQGYWLPFWLGRHSERFLEHMDGTAGIYLRLSMAFVSREVSHLLQRTQPAFYGFGYECNLTG